MKRRILLLITGLLLLFAMPGNALAQDYYFRMDQNYVDVYWNADGTLSLYYQMTFYADPAGVTIEYVDLGLPNSNFDVSGIQAEVDGKPVSYISSSEFEGVGSSGVAIALGSNSIPLGQTGTVTIWVGTVRDVLFISDEDSAHASAVFTPAYFQSSVVYGATDLQVTYHLPPGVQPDEPRWYQAPSGFPAEPVAGHDSDGRITYTWRNPNASPSEKYKFGASFPASYVPAGVVAAPTFSDRTGINEDTIMGFLCCGGIFAFIAMLTWFGAINERKRKMKYLPPKIRIEGHGIKRGLTAVEAAVLMELPPDKVLTMILFSVVKKGAASVLARDPLKLELSSPLPDGLHPYEAEFIKAFGEKETRSRRRKLQDVMIDLIKSVSAKMKGFSHKESVEYYRQIAEKAWKQVEDANTPEVKSEKFDEHMGWTMLDRDFDTRTQDVFRTTPVYVPMWWGRYDPSWAGSLKSAGKTAAPVSVGGGRSSSSMPTLPGGAFAASVVTGMQNFAGTVVGNISDFAGGITNKTNPIPKSTSSGGWKSSGGGRSCACACACAGCACACAGGGR